MSEDPEHAGAAAPVISPDAVPSGDRTMRYMTRFSCIGPACEEDCCHGWRIDVDADHFKSLQRAAAFSPGEVGKTLQSAFQILPPKRKKDRPRFIIKQDKDGRCPMLDGQGWCMVHGNFGFDMLPHVCAVYPRKLRTVGAGLELTATASCPEMARKILLDADAVEIVPLDRDSIHRKVLQEGMDPRDTRPFFRALVAVRDAFMAIMQDGAISMEERWFLVAWFAKRTQDILRKGHAKADLAPVERELALIARPDVRAAILARYERLETPATLGLLVARALVRPHAKAHIRPRWSVLANTVTGSYVRLRELLPESDDEAEHDRRALEALGSAGQKLATAEVWTEYLRRRDRVLGEPVAAARAEQYFRNYTIHTFFHRLATEENDVMSYVLRTLAQQAAMKFLFYSHPRVHAALDALRAAPADEIAAAEAHLVAELDATAADVFYQVARHSEHGVLLGWLVKMLAQQGWFSLAGAVYLIRF
ncbi:MAG: flagellin lysine-N-methylase [Myxococcales bacterium]|nr:flagellin lysine-N-methylase [Myxococcales bacterium]MCB9731428.1 flagellin lysine-N-methylase [Deltaproteobacteria bacterium]